MDKNSEDMIGMRLIWGWKKEWDTNTAAMVEHSFKNLCDLDGHSLDSFDAETSFCGYIDMKRGSIVVQSFLQINEEFILKRHQSRII